MGARPMSRLIQDSIKTQLAHEILFGDLVNGGRVDVTMAKNKPVVKPRTKQAA